MPEWNHPTLSLLCDVIMKNSLLQRVDNTRCLSRLTSDRRILWRKKGRKKIHLKPNLQMLSNTKTKIPKSISNEQKLRRISWKRANNDFTHILFCRLMLDSRYSLWQNDVTSHILKYSYQIRGSLSFPRTSIFTVSL